MYDSSLGRFLQRDPLQAVQGPGNSYAYVNDAPPNAWDPNGLQAHPADIPRPEVTFGNQFSDTTAFLKWEGAQVDVPKNLNIYTLVDMRWDVNDCGRWCQPARREGNYRFWFEGFVQSHADFVLGAYHGSHKSVNSPGTKLYNPNWPSFKNAKEWEAYMAESFNTKGTYGSLEVRFEYEGYLGRKPEEKFNPREPLEGGAPTETPEPNPVQGGSPWSPNRQRLFLRRSNAWLAEKPKTWGQEPDWWREVGFEFRWDWCGESFQKELKVFSNSSRY